MGQGKESLITGRHNQIRFPLSGTFAYAAHDDTLRSKRPKIGIQILYNHVCFYTALFQAVLQTGNKVIMQEELFVYDCMKSTL